MRLATIVLVVVSWLSGCALLPDQIDETKDWSAQKLYSEATSNISESDWEGAIDLLEKLEARYPFGRYAQQALLESAYVSVRDDDLRPIRDDLTLIAYSITKGENSRWLKRVRNYAGPEITGSLQAYVVVWVNSSGLAPSGSGWLSCLP